MLLEILAELLCDREKFWCFWVSWPPWRKRERKRDREKQRRGVYWNEGKEGWMITSVSIYPLLLSSASVNNDGALVQNTQIPPISISTCLILQVCGKTLSLQYCKRVLLGFGLSCQLFFCWRNVSLCDPCDTVHIPQLDALSNAITFYPCDFMDSLDVSLHW